MATSAIVINNTIHHHHHHRYLANITDSGANARYYDHEGALKFTVAVVFVFGVGVIALLGFYHGRSIIQDDSDKEANALLKKFEKKRNRLDMQNRKKKMLSQVSTIITNSMKAQADTKARPSLRLTWSEPLMWHTQNYVDDVEQSLPSPLHQQPHAQQQQQQQQGRQSLLEKQPQQHSSSKRKHRPSSGSTSPREKEPLLCQAFDQRHAQPQHSPAKQKQRHTSSSNSPKEKQSFLSPISDQYHVKPSASYYSEEEHVKDSIIHVLEAGANNKFMRRKSTQLLDTFVRSRGNSFSLLPQPKDSDIDSLSDCSLNMKFNEDYLDTSRRSSSCSAKMCTAMVKNQVSDGFAVRILHHSSTAPVVGFVLHQESPGCLTNHFTTSDASLSILRLGCSNDSGGIHKTPFTLSSAAADNKPETNNKPDANNKLSF